MTSRSARAASFAYGTKKPAAVTAETTSWTTSEATAVRYTHGLCAIFLFCACVCAPPRGTKLPCRL